MSSNPHLTMTNIKKVLDFLNKTQDVTRIDGITENEVYILHTLEGVQHRIGGPASYNKVLHMTSWYIHGDKHAYTLSYCKKCGFDDETTCMWILKYGEILPTFMSEVEYGLFDNT